MNTQRVFAFVRKDFKKMFREPASLFMVILFPVILTLAFGVSFGAIGSDQTVYQVGLINESAGQWSQTFADSLTAAKILNLRQYPDKDAAEKDLSQGKIQAFIIIPKTFEESCTSFFAAPDNPSLWVETTVDLYLDEGSMFATQAIPPIVQNVLTGMLKGEPTAPIPIHVGTPSLVESEKFSVFDHMAPGIFTFAAIFLIMIVAQSFTEDRERGLLRRINTTPTTSAEVMASQAIFYMGIVLVQVALVFAVATLVGYSPRAGTFGLLVAFVIVSVFALCCVGFGLITATITKSPGAATGVAFIFIIPQMFLGTFVTFGLSQGAQAIGKFVPSFYVTDALTSLLLRGAPGSSPTVVVDFAVVIVWSIVVMILGVLLFERYGNA